MRAAASVFSIRHAMVGSSADLDHVGRRGARVGERHRGVATLAAEEQHLRQAGEGGAAHHHGALADRRHLVALEKTHHAERGAADMAGLAAHEAAHRPFGESVDVLLERDLLEDLLHVETVGQGELAEDAVHRRIGGELGDGVVHLCLAGGGG